MPLERKKNPANAPRKSARYFTESPQARKVIHKINATIQQPRLRVFCVVQCFSCGFHLCVCAFVLLSLSMHCNVRGPVGVKRDLFKRGRKKPYGVAPDSLHDQTRSADTSFCTEDVSEDVPDFPVTLDSDGMALTKELSCFSFGLVRLPCWPSKISSSWHHALHPRVQHKHARFTPELCRRACSLCLDGPSMCNECDDVPCIAHLRHRVPRKSDPGHLAYQSTEHPFSVRACIRR